MAKKPKQIIKARPQKLSVIKSDRPRIDERFVCKALNLPPPPLDKNERYSAITLAEFAVKGCIAFTLFDDENFMLATPIYSDEQLTKLADTAMKKGAKLIFTIKQIKDYPCVLTDPEDLLNVYVQLMSAYRKRFDIATIGVTGSRGKTSTTEFIFTTLNEYWAGIYSGSNANAWNWVGRYFNGVQNSHKFYVQETQEGPTPGAASMVSRLTNPNFGVITNIGTSHFEKLGSVEGVMQSCLGIQDGMPDDGLLILNGDDELLANAETRLPRVYFGIDNKNADYSAENVRISSKGISFDVVHENKTAPLHINCLGEHNIYNALASFVVGKHMGLTDEQLAKSISKYRTRGFRQNLIEIRGRTVYMDCFNAAPESMIDALKTILSMPRKTPEGKYIAVLGELAEMGALSTQGHIEVGEFVRDSKLDMLICYGGKARDLYDAAIQNESIEAIFAENEEELAKLIKTKTTMDDIVLVKGSRGVKLEQAVDKAFGTTFVRESRVKWERITRVSKEEREAVKADTDKKLEILTDLQEDAKKAMEVIAKLERVNELLSMLRSSEGEGPSNTDG